MSECPEFTSGPPIGVLWSVPPLEEILGRSCADSVERLRDEFRCDGIVCCSPADLFPDAGAARTGIDNSGLSDTDNWDTEYSSVGLARANSAVIKRSRSAPPNFFKANGVPLKGADRADCLPHLLLLDSVALCSRQEQNVARILRYFSASAIPYTCILIGDEYLSHYYQVLGHHGIAEDNVFAVLPSLPRSESLRQIARRAIEHCVLQHKARDMERELQQHTHHLQELNSIGVALSSQRDLDQLLELILTKSRAITGSDASSLYLVESDAEGNSRLRFKLSQNESLTFSVDKPMVISRESLAGYVALTGDTLCFEDVYDLPDGVPYSFNRSFDQANGYRTKSMLVVPMCNHQGDIIGVLQLINRKLHSQARLSDEVLVEQEVVPYSNKDLELASSLASQAAVAIENSSLYQDIENLFEGFVTASARAIEQRDPTTSGHSERVEILTLGLANVVSRLEYGPYADICFSSTQIKELRYAALLHDFGKVGVREDVLLKRNKLYEHEYDLLRMRFDLVRTLREKETSERKVRALMQEDRETALAQFPAWDKELDDEMREMDEFLTVIIRANDPMLQSMEDSAYDRQKSALDRMRNIFYRDRNRHVMPLLYDHELRSLSVRRGSLVQEERREIEQHVNHTFDFLQQIPWTREYAMVPYIARCHHERCNGTGYPFGLHADQIPFQTRIMTIADIYDALTAKDRPYKRACSPDRAIDILYEEARDGHIEQDLLNVFVTYRVWKLTADWKKTS